MSKVRATVGFASCGIAAGAREVMDALHAACQREGIDVDVRKTGCVGMCYNEPLLDIVSEQGRWMYRKVTAEKVDRIVREHIRGGKPITAWLVNEVSTGMEEDKPFFKKQHRIVLRNAGIIDPENIDDYISKGGYGALEKALKHMSPEDVIREVMDSGLKGRGGAGFPTGMKWSFAKKASGDLKYLIFNADEGDPGAFMDRNILEGDPHSVLEGMIIAAYAIGCQEGYVYVRAEYPLAVKRLRLAISQAREKGFLGDNIMGTEFSFNMLIKEGAGAFVCGEETALIASI